MRRLKILTWHIHGSYLNTMAQIDHFLFSPMRYTSLPLAVIENGVSGYVPCNVDELIERMRFLLTAPDEARRLGANARASARALRAGALHPRLERGVCLGCRSVAPGGRAAPHLSKRGHLRSWSSRDPNERLAMDVVPMSTSQEVR